MQQIMRDIVNAVFIRPNGFLLARRSPQRKSYPGCWSFPGGHVEEGESLAGALVREINEELAVAPLRFEPLMRIPDPNALESITYHMYLVREWRGVPKIVDTEHSELRWLSIDEARLLDGLALEEYRGLFDLLQRRGLPEVC